MEEQKIGIDLYMLDWKDLRDGIIEKVHKKVPKIEEFVEKNFDLKGEIIRNLLCFAYVKSASMHEDFITEGMSPNHLAVESLLENYGYSLITDEKFKYPEGFSEFSDGFRYKNDGETFYQFIKLLEEKSSEIRDAIADANTSYIC